MPNDFKIRDTLKIRSMSLHLFAEGLGYHYYNSGYETPFHPKFKRISVSSMTRLHNAFSTSYDGDVFTFNDKDDNPIGGFTFDAFFGCRAVFSKIVENCKFNVKRGIIDVEMDSVNPNNNLVKFISSAASDRFKYWKDDVNV
jgi:hypothetical protein